LGFDGHAHFSHANSLRVLPREQQFHVEFDRLLRLPFGCMAKHHHTGRVGAESHHGWIPDGLFHLPLDGELDDLHFQSQHDHLPVDRRAHNRGLRVVPR
jgi:hypothetical protein